MHGIIKPSVSNPISRWWVRHNPDGVLACLPLVIGGDRLDLGDIPHPTAHHLSTGMNPLLTSQCGGDILDDSDYRNGEDNSPPSRAICVEGRRSFNPTTPTFAIFPPTASVPEYRCRYPLALEWPKYSTLPALKGLINMLSVGQFPIPIIAMPTSTTYNHYRIT